jgi:PAS domain S-box-containing protein
MTVMLSELAPRSDWREMRESEHVVQLYETDAFLLDAVHGFIGTGLRTGEAGIVVATSALRAGLAERLQSDGVDVPAMTSSGQYISLDAAETLSTFVVGGSPDTARFAEVIGGLVERASAGRRRLRIYGEMVAVLWADGDYVSAIHLERLWNDLQKSHSFSLLCGYPASGFGGEGFATSLAEVCAEHSQVIPAESYTAVTDPDERLRAIALLQQKANSLEAEIAERKEAEERFRFLAESMPEKIFTARPNGEVDYCNEQWAEYTGIPCEEMQNWGWTEVIHPADIEETIHRWRHSVATGEPFQLEHRLRKMNGVYRWHLTRAHAMRDVDGTVLMWIGSLTDIDEQKRREAALSRSIRLRDEFLAAISHDLKTPLTILQGQAQVLQRRAAQGRLDEESTLKALEQIEGRSRMMSRLIDELLDVTLLRAGEDLQLHRRPVDLVAIVRDAVAGQQEVVGIHELVVRSTESELTGSWDGVRLERVVENLICNAIKYSPDGGTITLTLGRDKQPEGDWAVLAVQDQGIGIAESDLPHIFEQFYRGKNATGAIGGIGLGLVGARQIVEQHSGTIAVESREGAGSTFVVRLPIDRE